MKKREMATYDRWVIKGGSWNVRNSRLIEHEVMGGAVEAEWSDFNF